MKTICKVLGHSWTYKDYTNWIKENGDNYDFTAARKCMICKQHEYLYDQWKAQDKNIRYDIQNDANSTKQLKILEIQ